MPKMRTIDQSTINLPRYHLSTNTNQVSVSKTAFRPTYLSTSIQLKSTLPRSKCQEKRKRKQKQETKKHKYKMRKTREKKQSFTNAKKLKNTTPAAAALSTSSRSTMGLLYLLLAILMSVSTVAVGLFPPKMPPATENESHISALYIMGDSSVDCGENSLFYPLLHRNLSLFPCDGSDSSLLPHLLAEKMGLPNPPPFYSQNGSIEGLRGGLNYGSAHATIINPSSQSHQSFNQQLRQVYETFQLLQLQLTDERAQHFIKSSMFYLSFGKDDYVDLFLRNASGLMFNYSGQELGHILVNQMAHAMQILYDANVRKIICMGILPLGCTPRVVWEWYNSTAIRDIRGCVEKINQLVLQYNSMLNERIVELNVELPDAQIIFCDVYQGMLEFITNPTLYGFRDTKNACCGLGLHGAAIGCVSKEMACNQSSAHVWWDLYNPTQALNSLLADSAWSGYPLPSICRPITVQDLVYTSVSQLT